MPAEGDSTVPSDNFLNFLVTGSLTPRRGPWWTLFISTNAKYENNGTYFAAWCIGCVAAHMQRNALLDETQVGLGILDQPRSIDELRRLGK